MRARPGTPLLYTLLAILWVSAPWGVATAQERAWRLGIAAGYGERTNPLIQSKDIPVVIDLDIAWFGRRLFFDNGDIGYTFADGEAGTASLVARLNSDRVFFGKTNTRLVNVVVLGPTGSPVLGPTGVPLTSPVPLDPPDRDYAVEAGLEYLIDGRPGRLALSVFHDVSSVHGGFAIDLEYGYPLYGRRWTLEPAVMARYKSRALNDYYWGVRASEANAALPEYRAGDGVNLQAGLRGSYFLTRNTRLVGAVTVERLNSPAAHSPIVADLTVLGWFGGVAYQF
jgi:MipA family protein